MRAQHLILSATCSLLLACGAPEDDGLLVDDEIAMESDADKLDAADIATRAVAPGEISPESVIGTGELRRVFTGQGGVRAFFGGELGGVDFSKSWVLFYGAGTRSSGGYEAKVLRVRLEDGGRTLGVVTRLRSPGQGCLVTRNLTRPYALVSIARPQPAPVLARFYRSDETYRCD